MKFLFISISYIYIFTLSYILYIYLKLNYFIINFVQITNIYIYILEINKDQL